MPSDCSAPVSPAFLTTQPVVCANEAKHIGTEWLQARLNQQEAAPWFAMIAIWGSLMFGSFFFRSRTHTGGRIANVTCHTLSALTVAMGVYLCLLTCDATQIPSFIRGPEVLESSKAPHCAMASVEANDIECGAYNTYVHQWIIVPSQNGLAALLKVATTEAVGVGYASYITLGLVCGFLGDFNVSARTSIAMLLFGIGHLAYVLAFDSLLDLCGSGVATGILIPLRVVMVVVCFLFGFRHVIAAVSPKKPLFYFAIAYGFLLVETACKGLAVSMIRPRHFWGLGLGAVLFFISDMAVASRLFGKRERFGIWPLSRLHIHDTIWVLYSTAQMLLAASIVSAHAFI